MLLFDIRRKGRGSIKDFFGYIDDFLSTKKGYKFLRILNPTPCFVCGEIAFVDEGPLCLECYEKFSSLLTAVCPFCHAYADECECNKISGIEEIFFAFWYETALSRKIVSKLKYAGDRRQLSYCGKLISQKVLSCETDLKIDAVCYAPRSKRNEKKIGFDQAKFLAESVAFYLNVPLLHCLERTGRSAEQKKLSGIERMKNVKNKFRVNHKRLKGYGMKPPARLLLVDDVITTGATIRECSYFLRKAGVKKVYAACVAKTPLKRKKKRYKKVYSKY
jgi:competence protein ComFC